MITQLVRTELQSNHFTLVLFALFSLPILMITFAANGPLFPIMIFPLLLYGVMGISIYLRHSREKRTRLFSQLPVSRQQVCVAGWSFALLTAAMPACTFLVFVVLDGNRTISQSLPHILSLYLAAATLITAIAIAIKPTNLSASVSRYWKWVPAAVVVIFLFFWVNSADMGILFFLEKGQPNWALTLAFLLFLSIGFVLVDIWLHRRADNYLG